MRADDFGEHGLDTVRLGDRVFPVGQRAFRHQHRVAHQSTTPHREHGTNPRLERDTSLKFAAQHFDHGVIRERLDNVGTNRLRQSLRQSAPEVLQERHRDPRAGDAFGPVAATSASFELARRGDERAHRFDAVDLQLVEQTHKCREPLKTFLGDDGESRFGFQIGRVVRVTGGGFRIAKKKVGTLTEEDFGFRREIGEFDALAGVVVTRSNRRRGTGRLVAFPEE
ncbi:MAG: hypothetical protein RJA31_368 [Actinomycetota bacterium]